MIINKMENGIWTSIDTERNEVLCTIESLGNHIRQREACRQR